MIYGFKNHEESPQDKLVINRLNKPELIWFIEELCKSPLSPQAQTNFVNTIISSFITHMCVHQGSSLGLVSINKHDLSVNICIYGKIIINECKIALENKNPNKLTQFHLIYDIITKFDCADLPRPISDYIENYRRTYNYPYDYPEELKNGL